MIQTHEQFKDNVARVKDLGNLVTVISGMVTQALDLSDILRAQLVMAVSALDHLAHELTRLGVIQVGDGTRPKTDAFRRLQIPFEKVELAILGVSPEQWLGETVREKHSWLSFQDPDKIADAIRLFSTLKIWEEVGGRMGMSAGDVKIQLRAIIDRRNKIAHEADIDPANPGFRWPIDEIIVRNAVNFIETFGHSIFDAVK